MRRLFWAIMAVLFLVPRSSSAIQLHWLSGATDLTLPSATREALVVRADSAEVTLPASWRLQWIADSSGIRFVALDSLLACLADTAKVDSMWGPSTPADSAANQITAHFCSAGTGSASVAYFLLDLVGGSKGRLKVVALNPADTTQVIESNEVTYNGGVTGDYSPLILGVSVSHEGSPLVITATGTSLGRVTSAAVLTPDTTWTIPLTIEAQTDTSITATGAMSQALQGSSLVLSSATGSTGLSPVPDDPVYEPPIIESSVALLWLFDPSAPSARPKDFAFIYNTVYIPPPMGRGWEGVYHVFYARHFNDSTDANNEAVFVHAWFRGSAPGGWNYDTAAFTRGHAYWDTLHVWAPSIIFRGGQYVMYYTGVDISGNQRIGYATIDTIGISDTNDSGWHKQPRPTFRAEDAGWTAKATQQQCRDPYVMPNPDGAGLIMVYAALDSATRAMAVGLAKCPIGLTDWRDAGHYVATDAAHSHAQRVESPHVFADSVSAAIADNNNVPLGQVPNVTWRIMFTDGNYALAESSVITIRKSASALTDTLSGWSGPLSLYSYAKVNPQGGGTPGVTGLEATECLRAGKTYVLAGFQVDGGGFVGINFRRAYWSLPGMVSNPEFLLSVGGADVTAVRQARGQNGDLRFAVGGLVPARGRVRFRIETPVAIRARVVVYDVMGRVVKRVLDQAVPNGVSYVSWDGRGETGRAAGSGIYFARLSSGGQSRVARISLVR